MTDIVQLLGKEADTLLQHRCMTIPADSLYLPDADYVDRVMIDNNRSPAVLRNMQAPRSPPIRPISTRRISSSWRLKPAVTVWRQLMACWPPCHVATRTASRLWSS